MSSERGNIGRTRKQKHTNKTAFKNTLHDTSRRTNQLNTMDITEVCRRCQDVIAWKVKYKKYKPLSQPKTCTRCHHKNIKDAYHIVCRSCAEDLRVCCKCGKKEEIVAHNPPSRVEKLQTTAELEAEVKSLSERKRRAYYRYLEKLNSNKSKKTKKKDKGKTGDTNLAEEEEEEKEEENGNEEKEMSVEEYFRNARRKLDELMKGMEEEDEEFYEDLKDLNLSDEEEEEEEEEGEEGGDFES